MTVESLAIDNNASFRKLKDFPVVPNELTFLTSTLHHGKEQSLSADDSNLNNESNLNNKHSEIIDLDIQPVTLIIKQTFKLRRRIIRVNRKRIADEIEWVEGQL